MAGGKKSKRNIVIIVIAVVLVLGVIGSYRGEDSSSSGSSSSSAAEASSSTAAEQGVYDDGAAQRASADDFVEAVKEAIAGDVSTSKGEAVTDVAFDGDKLTVRVDMGSSYDDVELAGDLTMAQVVALSRFSSITDSILEMRDYSGLWDTVVVDFGSNGSITKRQSEAVDSAYGRYFDVQDSDLA